MNKYLVCPDIENCKAYKCLVKKIENESGWNLGWFSKVVHKDDNNNYTCNILSRLPELSIDYIGTESDDCALIKSLNNQGEILKKLNELNSKIK